MTTYIYLVYGEAGEYGDACEWPVKAFADPVKADEFCKKLNDWCKKNGASNGHGKVEECPYDPRFDNDYAGTTYSVVPIELIPRENVNV